MNASRLLPLAATLCALAFPLASQAESKNNGNNGHHENEGGNNGNNGHHENDGGTAPVPEPAAWLSMGTLAAAAAVYARRQTKQQKNAY